MASTSPSELAVELLNHCLGGSEWPPDLLQALVQEALDEDDRVASEATRALFTIVIERLSDLFEPRLCDVYARLFSRVLNIAYAPFEAGRLEERYREVRQVRPVAFEPQDVFVCSRVTLGADVAVTSIVLDGARRRFPNARIWFAGPQKAWELFQSDPRLQHLPVSYGRTGLLRDRLAAYEPLLRALESPKSLLLDPDSRLTQLGLLPVCDASRHHLFESRSYGGETDAPLSELTQHWVAETLGLDDAEPYLYPRFHYDFGEARVITSSLGVGENPAKRLPDPFEEGLVSCLADHGGQVFIDSGAPNSEEADRVHCALGALGEHGGRVGVHSGSFASFAAMVARSSLYVGYDSACQHVAAALGVPLVTVFAGYVSERMFARWSPCGPGPKTVLKVPAGPIDPAEWLARTRDAVAAMLA